jgi:hypothetical protein
VATHLVAMPLDRQRLVEHEPYSAELPIEEVGLLFVRTIRMLTARPIQTFFWFSMYRLITANGAPPTVETKKLLVQSVGRQDFNQGNSCRGNREDRPLIALTARCTPNCGSTSSRMRTWSGMTSLSSNRLSVFGNLSDNLLEPLISASNQDRASVFRAKHHVVLARKNNLPVRSITHRLGRDDQYNSQDSDDRYSIKSDALSSPCLKAGVPRVFR